MENRDNLVSVIAALMRWRKSIFWVVGLTVLGSAVISFAFLPNYYKSTTAFDVASTDLFKPEQMFGNSTKDIDYFGNDADRDRVLSMAQSTEMQEFLIKKFDLYRHYDIDSTKNKAQLKISERLLKLFTVSKNKYDKIEITVEDTDKQFAMNMANAAREQLDVITQRFIRSSQAKLLEAYKTSSIEKEKVLRDIDQSLNSMRQSSGVIDPSQQTEVVTKTAVEAEANYFRSKAKLDAMRKLSHVSRDTIELLSATVKGYEEEYKLTQEMIKKYNAGFNDVSTLKQFYEFERTQQGRDKLRFTQLLIAYNTQISALHVTQPATLPLDKSRPKRSLILLATAVISLIFSMLGVLLLETYRQIDWSEVARASASSNGISKKILKNFGLIIKKKRFNVFFCPKSDALTHKLFLIFGALTVVSCWLATALETWLLCVLPLLALGLYWVSSDFKSVFLS
ncbi:MAG: hypothetical protein HC817_11095 [Saprospiraceae bacterium]|nr:hypothetical protein [Saprospiraceae bacterium]